MNSFEINKIIAAILFTVLLIYGIGKISDVVFDVKEQNVVAYKVEAPEGSIIEVGAESSIDISAFLATGDINHGEKVFKKCAACHSVNRDGGNKIGPKLWM